jgi:small subunit ribosomal protein S3Ae
VKGRVVTVNQADLARNQDPFIWRKVKLIVDDIQNRVACTSFYGVDMTRDQFSALIKKRKSLIEAISDCKSADGYVIRVFVIGITRETPGLQKKKTNYALASQQKEIRRRINEVIARDVAKSNATQLLNLLTSDSIENSLKKAVSQIYPMKHLRIRKVKVIQRPKVDSTKLSEMHDAEKRILGKGDNKKAKGKGERKGEPQQSESANLVNKEVAQN